MSRVTLVGKSLHDDDYVVVGLDPDFGFFLQHWVPGDAEQPALDVSTHTPFKEDRISRGRLLELLRECAAPSDRLNQVCLIIAGDLDPALA